MTKLTEALQSALTTAEQNSYFVQNMDEYVISDIIKILYQHTQGNLMQYFLNIDQYTKDAMKLQIRSLKTGIQDSTHIASSLSRHLLEDKTSRTAKQTAAYLFESDDGQIAQLINTAKVLFPDGTSEHCSDNERWWFSKFVKTVIDHKHRYLHGGSSHEWAKTYHHLDYITLIITKYDKQ